MVTKTETGLLQFLWRADTAQAATKKDLSRLGMKSAKNRIHWGMLFLGFDQSKKLL